LVKLQEYSKAEEVQKEVEEIKNGEILKRQRANQETVETRCSNLKKQQSVAMGNLLRNIQKDRNDQIKQRKADSDKLILRNRALVNEIHHRHNEAMKKLYESLHNICLEGEQLRTRRSKRSD
jgi:hypothetical protein